MISLLLVLAVGLSSWSILISNLTLHSAKPEDPKQADAYMTQVIATNYNKEGKPALKITSPKMIHYPNNDSTDITTPCVLVYRDSSHPWDIDAQFAKTTHGINEILFWNHVNIHHAADEANPVTTMLTESLTILPQEKIASTKDAITFIQPDTKIHAVGMLADLNSNTIKLLSQTEGEYAPSS